MRKNKIGIICLQEVELLEEEDLSLLDGVTIEIERKRRGTIMRNVRYIKLRCSISLT
jgi:hypothetical protein